MAPAIVSSRARSKALDGTTDSKSLPSAMVTDPNAQKILDEMRTLKAKLLATSEDVGTRFPEEARRIHFGEAEVRAIHGAATLDDARQLHEDGVEFGILPRLPDEQN